MPFNGSGSFVRVYNWVNDANASVNITASRFDTEDSGFATGLSNCITKDGQQTVTQNIPWNNKKITGLGAGTGATDAAQIGQVQSGQLNWVAAAGTADALTAVYSPVNTALTDGLLLFTRASAANATTTPTFSPDGLTAHTITKSGGVALAAGDIVGAGHELELRYNLANTRWELLNPGVVPTTNATIIAALLTAYASGVGTISSSDSILTAIQKLNGNFAAGTIPSNTITVTSNAGTCPVTSGTDTFINSSAATMAITLATAGAVDAQRKIVRIYDFSGVTQTIGWTNIENSLVVAPTTSNGSTTLPLTVGFELNGATSKWRCIAYA